MPKSDLAPEASVENGHGDIPRPPANKCWIGLQEKTMAQIEASVAGLIPDKQALASCVVKLMAVLGEFMHGGDVESEPEELTCPITRLMFRDPVVLVSGNTFERDAISSHFRINGISDPLTRTPLSDQRLIINWHARKSVQAWLEKCPFRTPAGWDGRAMPAPACLPLRADFTALHVLRDWWPQLAMVWSSDVSENEWEGVTVKDGRVTKLALEGLDLHGKLPAEIGRLTALEVLQLNDNLLTNVPRDLAKLSSLRVLELHDNLLKTVPEQLWQLNTLTRLDLSANELTSLPAQVGRLTSLIELYLYENLLTSLPSEIGNLCLLKALYLGNNQLTSVPVEISKLSLLVWLRLDNNKLTTVPAEFGCLSALRELYLYKNRLTKFPAKLSEIASLNDLRLAVIG